MLSHAKRHKQYNYLTEIPNLTGDTGLTPYHFDYTRHLESSCGQVIDKVGINKWHNSISEIRRGQRILRSSWQGLPSNQWLLSTDCASQAARMVDGPDALVLDQWSSPRERVAVGGTIPVTVSRWAHCYDVGGCGGAGAGEEDDYALPIVAVAEAG